MNGIIYQAYNKINKKSYVGQTTKTLAVRIKNHYYKLKPGNKCANNKFQNALRKYNKQDWEWVILTLCPKEDLNEQEKYWIKYFDSYYKGYNGNFGGQDGVKVSKIYELYHPVYGEFSGTNVDVINELNCTLNVPNLLYNKKIKQYKGWVLIEYKSNYKEYITQRKERKKPTKVRILKKLPIKKYKIIYDGEDEVTGTAKELGILFKVSRETISNWATKKEFFKSKYSDIKIKIYEIVQ